MGCSFDTSMGLTPLEGLVMGTRSGDMDPAIPFYVMRKAGMSPADAEKALNKSSGRPRDHRASTPTAATSSRPPNAATSAPSSLSTWSPTASRSTSAAITPPSAASTPSSSPPAVGEMGPTIRGKATEGLAELGIVVDPDKNAKSKCRNAETEITGKGSKIRVFVIPTDEELVMTEDAYALMNGTYDVPHEVPLQLPGPRATSTRPAPTASCATSRRSPT